MVFIVIDGTDGSGKGTQSEILIKRLNKEGYKTALFDFPRYGKASAKMIEDYLNGKLGSIKDVSPKAASILYAVDRFAAKSDIKKSLDDGLVVVSNRYVSSNMGHQAGKIDDKEERKKFVEWLEDLEFGIFNVPKPDLNIFLDVPPEIGQKLVDKKEERDYTNGKKRDIHEDDISHLKNAYSAYTDLCKEEGWVRIECVKDGKLMEKEDIAEEIWNQVKKKI